MERNTIARVAVGSAIKTRAPPPKPLYQHQHPLCRSGCQSHADQQHMQDSGKDTAHLRPPGMPPMMPPSSSSGRAAPRIIDSSSVGQVVVESIGFRHNRDWSCTNPVLAKTWPDHRGGSWQVKQAVLCQKLFATSPNGICASADFD